MRNALTKKLVFSLIVGFLILSGSLAYAQEGSFQVAFDIPCPDFPGFPDCPPINTPSIANYLNNLYRFAIGIVGIMAVGVIAVGAIQYALSAGNADRQRDATSRITSALWGIALLLGAVLLFNIVNPRISSLVEPRPCGPGEEADKHNCIGKAPTTNFSPLFGSSQKACSAGAITEKCSLGLPDEEFQECLEDNNEEITRLYSQEAMECANSFPRGGHFTYSINNINYTGQCEPYFKVTGSPGDYKLELDKQNNPILNNPPNGDPNIKFCP